MPLKRPLRLITDFMKMEASGGIVLFLMAVLALIMSNSPLSHYYEYIFKLKLNIHVNGFGISKPIILWINDGLMAIFFFLVGLEIKRELIEGELNSLSRVTLPGIAAIGGMVVPALIYFIFNHDNPIAHPGWAIPVATDIAFALGVLSLAGSRVDESLKILLTAVAIFDDIGAIIIIAVFYTQNISLLSLGLGAICCGVLFLLNRSGIKRFAPYFITGLLLWLFVLKSGVHATLAGVILAFAIPMRGRGDDPSPVKRIEKKLHPWVVFGVLPVFSFANAGVSFYGLTMKDFLSPLPLGIAAGLFIGKQIGIFGAAYAAVKAKIASLPGDASWAGIYGVSLVCGIGFTMSLFIGTLAFTNVAGSHAALVRLGVIGGSLLSGVAGFIVLYHIAPRMRAIRARKRA